jgi:kynureninase
LIRLAPSPLYTTFAECAEAIARLQRIVSTGTHEKFSAQPALVP